MDRIRSYQLSLVVGLLCVAVFATMSAVNASPVQHNPSPLGDLALNSVSVAPASTSAWAVGNSISDGVSGSILHLKAGRWKPVAYTSATGQVHLNGVAAASAHAVWAVGDVQGATSTSALVLHSTGGAFGPASLPGTAVGTTLVDVAASSATNAWAVGNDTANGLVPVAYRLVRGKWTTAALPHLPAEYQLESVTTSGPTNTWILAPGPANGQAALLHWNGKKWSKSTLTAMPKTGDAIAIATAGSGSTWVVGFTQTSPTKSFSSHWNGKRWSAVAVPSAATELLDVATGGTTAVAAGNGKSGPVAVRFSKGKWRAERTDSRGHDAQLHGVGVSSKLAVAVGSDLSGGQFMPLIDIRSGGHWKRSPA